MARQKQQDSNSANEKPSSRSAGNKSLADAPEGLKEKGKSSKDKVDPMKKD